MEGNNLDVLGPVRRSGGQLVADGRIPTQALLAALEAEEKPKR
jgi:hypothetical protein